MRLHVARTDRVWVRDSGPTGVHRPDGSVELVQWGFNAWAKYENYLHDTRVPEHIAEHTDTISVGPTTADAWLKVIGE